MNFLDLMINQESYNFLVQLTENKKLVKRKDIKLFLVQSDSV